MREKTKIFTFVKNFYSNIIFYFKSLDVDTRWLDREYKEKTGQNEQKVNKNYF